MVAFFLLKDVRGGGAHRLKPARRRFPSLNNEEEKLQTLSNFPDSNDLALRSSDLVEAVVKDLLV